MYGFVDTQFINITCQFTGFSADYQLILIARLQNFR